MPVEEPQKIRTELNVSEGAGSNEIGTNDVAGGSSSGSDGGSSSLNADGSSNSGTKPQLDDRYEILGKIGEGGMGTVYKVKDRMLEKVFAIKMVKDELLADKSYVKRFEQEAQGAIGLTHPNIVSVYGHRLNPDGKPYLVMDFYEGESLGQLLEREKRLDVDKMIGIFVQVADALHHAHAKGIVHRDLKPNNILLVRNHDGGLTVKVLDFGIAKIIMASGGATTQGMTQEHQVLGSPFYMSPEQCRADKLDARADIYSLGCVMFETLAGKPPYHADTPIQTLMRHVSSAVPSLDVELGLPEEIKQVVAFCMQKNPADRFQSMQELREDLERVHDGGTPRCAPKLKKLGGRTIYGTVSSTSSGAKSTMIVLAAVLGLSLLFVAYSAWKTSSSSPMATAPTAGAALLGTTLPNDAEGILNTLESVAQKSEPGLNNSFVYKLTPDERRERSSELSWLVDEAIRKLNRVGPSAIPACLKHAASDSMSVRRLTASVLKENQREALPGVVELLINSRNDKLLMLCRELSRMGTPAVQELVKWTSNDGSSKARYALELLTQTYVLSGSPGDFEVGDRQKLEQILLTSPDAQARKFAVILLASTGAQDEAVREAVIKSALNDRNVGVRALSLSSLGAIASSEGTSAANETLKILAQVLETDKDSYARFAAAVAIAVNGTKSESVRPSIQKAVNDRDATVGVAAKTALALLQPLKWGSPERQMLPGTLLPIDTSTSVETIKSKLDIFPNVTRSSFHTYPKNTNDSPGFSVPGLILFVCNDSINENEKGQAVNALINVGQYGVIGIPWVYFHSLNSSSENKYNLRESASVALEKLMDKSLRTVTW
jgi:Serine/threonine protein kinase